MNAKKKNPSKKVTKAKADTLSKRLLIEIGTEELPATNLADIFESSGENVLLARFKKVLDDKRIAYESAQVWATPRRLVFLAQGVGAKQSAKEEKIKLLVKDEAIDGQGRPTPKLLTILGHRKASFDDTFTDELGGKTYIFLKKIEPVLETMKLLPEIFSQLVQTIGFPKNMRWNDSPVFFARPIRNALCVFGDKVITFKTLGISAGNFTVVFQKAKRAHLKVSGVDAYFKLLRGKGVILDPVERKAKIQKILSQLVEPVKARIYEDPFLLSEVNFLVETPEGLISPFSKEFLTLPLEVLAVSMARKQRIFGVTDSTGTLAPYILAILDGQADKTQKKIISFNVENILKAKLQDSLFFYREDSKVSLEHKRRELANLVFLKGCGSMLEKTDRLVSLCAWLSQNTRIDNASIDKQVLERSALLCKSDLLSQMVGEFPELQGVMGKYYALENRESEVVATAIGEQYLPRTVTDALPVSLHGSLLSLLDKHDLICACFALGLEPSSSADPYGLRRSATAVLKILIEKNIHLSLADLTRQTLESLSGYCKKDKEEVFKKVNAFYQDRFKHGIYMPKVVERSSASESLNVAFEEDIFNAACPVLLGDALDTLRKVEAIRKIANEPSFEKSVKVLQRLYNILKGFKEPIREQVDSALFDNDYEKKVFEVLQAQRQSIEQAANKGDYRQATSLYANAFFDILGEFFEKVFVNAPDPNVRHNRMALLHQVKVLYSDTVADLSRIRLN